MTNPNNLPAIFLCHILITSNMQSKTGFPSSHQLKSYVAPKYRLKLAARCPVSGCWPSCYNGDDDEDDEGPCICQPKIHNGDGEGTDGEGKERRKDV